MIIDTSALVAILRREPDAQAVAEAIAGAPARRISAGTYLERGIVIDGAGDAGASLLMDELLAELGVIIEPVTAAQALIAPAAYRGYGRGSGGPARLNFGDCFAYALAKDLGEPVLFKGANVAATDIGFAGPRAVRHRLRELLARYGARRQIGPVAGPTESGPMSTLTPAGSRPSIVGCPVTSRRKARRCSRVPTITRRPSPAPWPPWRRPC